MQYIDSSIREADRSVGCWLEDQAPEQINALRMQSGYFGIQGVGAISALISELSRNNRPTSFVIGSNDGDTLGGDVVALLGLMDSPRTNGKVAIVSYAGGLFHPKVYHLTRFDGSQAAYIGSANLTKAGIAGTNIEAGVLIDSAQGDPIEVLVDIASSIDRWFNTASDSTDILTSVDHVQPLVANGILSVARPPRAVPPSQEAENGQPRRPRLRPLKSFPVVDGVPRTNADRSSDTQAPSRVGAAVEDMQTLMLVAEIGKGGRWKQANFPIAIMKDYFNVDPTAGANIELRSIAEAGEILATDSQQIVAVKSQNYRIELKSVAGVAYPNEESGRPIGVFRRVSQSAFRYRVYLPEHGGYEILDELLAEKYDGAARQLRRITLRHDEMIETWSECPV